MATLLLNLAGLYLALGLVFAIAFVTKGVGRIDPDAAQGSWGFRLLILPGSTLLWPLLLKRWMSGARPAAEHNAHRDAAVESEVHP